jgi:putative aldouronate transport system permease protein
MEVLTMYIYRKGLLNLDFSYATAAGIILSFTSLVLVFGSNLISRKTLGRSIY